MRKGVQTMAATITYLERYLAGEHEHVWAELTALSAAVREEPVFSDALAVARETMRRARHNIELLVARLGALGYQFGYAWWDANYLDMLEDDPCPPVFAVPQPDVQHQLAELEARVGPLPLSLHAWYEQIGAVNFVGMYPVADSTDPDGFTCYVQYMRSGARRQGCRFTQDECPHDLDPLFVDSIDSLLRHLDRREELGRPVKRNGTHELDLAPDEWLKYGVSGGGPYVIKVPDLAADAAFGYEWHNTSFVNYLRICFRWAGFPGLECKAQRPETELAFLTLDLCPI
jgi:hypothetical protein